MTQSTNHQINRYLISRRDRARLTAGGVVGATFARLGAARQPDSRVVGVQIGVQSYSFRDRSLDDAIRGMVDAGIGSCELWQGHVEPSNLPEDDAKSRDALRTWRLSVPLDYFRTVRKTFDRAGVALSAYNLSFNDSFTDAEIDRGFEMAKALGVTVMTASSNLTTVPRIDRAAQRYGIPVGLHNHSHISPNEFATPDDFATALSGRSTFIAINLDIGHFTAANFDALAFLRQHHARIVSLHIKDRKRDQGDYVPFGEGDAPIGVVLRTLRDEHWSIPANIEYEYKGSDTIGEVKRSFEYCKRMLAT